ncbi:MAG: sensor domain-containing diguanylate cyclase [Spirochaetales bacterium]|nr:sensor domain-containing diguanylate cyclase [Spirochaetales bacterium]
MKEYSSESDLFHLGYAEFKIHKDENGEITSFNLKEGNKVFRDLAGIGNLENGSQIPFNKDSWTLRIVEYCIAAESDDNGIIENFVSTKKWSITQIIKSGDSDYRAVYMDITNFYESLSEYEIQKDSYKFFLDNIQGLAFQVLSGGGRMNTFQLGAYEKLTGYNIDKFRTIESFFSLIYPDDLERVKNYNSELYKRKNRVSEIEYRILTKAGQVKWLRSYDQNIVDPKGVNLVQGIMFDVTTQKEQEIKLLDAYSIIKEQNAKLDDLSKKDSLTELFNRRALVQLIEDEITRYNRLNTGFSIIMIDLDYFKNINDRYGHNVGDQVLINVSRTFRLNLRRLDKSGRWGGEEFLILLPGIGPDGAWKTAEKLRKAVKMIEIPHGDDIVGVTFSAGVVTYEGDESFEHLVDRADMGLYSAKEAGRDRVLSGPSNTGK